MASGALVSVEEYLSTSYDPDCDYVDGVIEERNSGEFDHASLQGAVFAWFYNRRKQLGITVVPEQRVQVGPTRFRIPDVCIRLGHPGEQIFTTDYLRMGMRQVEELRTENPEILVPLDELFEA